MSDTKPLSATAAGDAETAPTEANARLSSDSENSEQIRRRFRKTTIDPATGAANVESREGSADADAMASAAENGEDRGRLRRKRSFEEVDENAPEAKGKHARKRSRDGEAEATVADEIGSKDKIESSETLDAEANDIASRSEAAEPGLKIRPGTPDKTESQERDESLLISPKNKRTRDQFLQDTDKSNDPAAEGQSTTANNTQSPAIEQRAKRVRDSNSPPAPSDKPVGNTASADAPEENKDTSKTDLKVRQFPSTTFTPASCSPLRRFPQDQASPTLLRLLHSPTSQTLQPQSLQHLNHKLRHLPLHLLALANSARPPHLRSHLLLPPQAVLSAHWQLPLNLLLLALQAQPHPLRSQRSAVLGAQAPETSHRSLWQVAHLASEV